MVFSPQQCALLLDTAREAIVQALTGKPPGSPRCHDQELLRPAGCFVSLHEHNGKLRGCIGRLDANEPLLSSLTSAAVSVLNDPRFANERITAFDLPHLTIELSIVSPMRPAGHMLAFDPKNDGIYLTIGNRNGCFLPQVGRQTGWTREQLLARLCTEKLGMSAHSWQRPGARLSLFSAIIVGPEPFERAIVLEQNVKPIEA